MSDKKSEGQLLEEKLIKKYKPVWRNLTSDEQQTAFALGKEYRSFLDNAKTERAAIKHLAQQAVVAGFVTLDEIKKNKQQIKIGDRIMVANREKQMMLII